MSQTAAVTLARFAAGLSLADVPAPVVGRARNCIIDTVGVAAFGSRFPWSQAVARYASRFGSGGRCTVLGLPQLRLPAQMAALVNGSFAHAFEQDSLRKPGAGVHPGAVLLPAALAAAEQGGASGERLLLAFIAGCEVMFRIGAASKHSSEGLGFHAPGLTGPYGAAIAAGVVMGLSAEQLANALGIAGSLSSGLLAFTKSAGGGEVKRLHLGRAAEAGVLAAGLAAEGFGGPETILEGRFGFLETYCRDADASKLTADLGERWEVERICIKAFPCHVTAHTPVESLRTLMAEHGFAGDDVENIRLSVSEKVLSHHDIRAPGDLMQAQYSVPFCVALALYRDPSDPRSFNEDALADARIAAACRGIVLQPHGEEAGAKGAWQSRLELQLRDGRSFDVDRETFRGAPEQPLDDAATDAKYRRLAADLPGEISERWLSSLRGLESLSHLDLR